VQLSAQWIALPFPRHHVFLGAAFWIIASPLLVIKEMIDHRFSGFSLERFSPTIRNEFLKSPKA
jgi:hypothetical protein